MRAPAPGSSPRERGTGKREHSPRSRSRERGLGGAGLLWLILLLLSGCGLLNGGPEVEEEGPPERQPVETLVVQPTSFEEWIETTGTLEAPDDATLSAEAAGTVLRLVAEGAPVRRGQVIAELDPGLAAAGVRQAEAAVADARAAQAQTEDAFRRQQPLLRDSIVSPLEFQQVRAQRDQARAGVRQAQATLQEAQERLEQSRLRAPFDGVVERHLVRRGEQANPGQEVIRVVGSGRVEVTAGIPERFAGEVRVGTPAVVRLNAYELGERRAPISFVGATIDPQSRTFPIRIDLPDGGGALKAEMIASVRVVRRVLPNALVLPLEAVQRDERGESVLTAEAVAAASDSLRVLHRRTVTLGARSGEDVVVESGLQPGDEVVVLGRDEVATGDTVRVATRHQGRAAFRAALAADTAAATVQ